VEGAVDRHAFVCDPPADLCDAYKWTTSTRAREVAIGRFPFRQIWEAPAVQPRPDLGVAHAGRRR
jgi:hypothetical protein